jgi:primosomal replication protein N
MPELAQSSREPVNQTTIEGVVLQPVDFRYTPAGRAVALLTVEHISQASPSASMERLELRMPVVALGELAERCRNIAPGQHIRAEGSLNQKRWIRDGKVRWGKTELFAQTIQISDSTSRSNAKLADATLAVTKSE